VEESAAEKTTSKRAGRTRGRRRRGGGRGGARGYQEDVGELGVAGGGRTAPESSMNCGGRNEGNNDLATVEGSFGRFRAPGGRGERGALIGGGGEAWGGRRWSDEDDEGTVAMGIFLLSRFACRGRRRAEERRVREGKRG
jgi:hypothetical protein